MPTWSFLRHPALAMAFAVVLSASPHTALAKDSPVYVPPPVVRVPAGDPAANLASMSDLFAAALDVDQACRSVMSSDDIATLLQHERDRQLLGGEPNDKLAAQLAATLGAEELALFTVTRTDGGYQVAGTLLDVSRGSALLRTSASVADVNGLVDAIASVGATLAQAERCRHWHGTISVRREMDPDATQAAESVGVAVTDREEIVYALERDSRARFRASVRITVAADGLRSQDTGQGEGPAQVSVDMRADGSYTIDASNVEFPTSYSATILGFSVGGSDTQVLAGPTVDGKASPGAKRLEGRAPETYTAPGMTSVVTWTLSSD
jgi:hypothetical protein